MQSYQGASKVLYVGNLDKRCTEEFLKQVFGKIAPVERCKMITDHTGSDPYCFVEFQDHDSAKNALDTMNGRRVFDQDIKVNWATSNTGMRKDTSSHFHIFVGDLPDEMTTDLLKNSFEKFGKVSDARVVCDAATGTSRGYGFVSFFEKANAENAIKDMNGKTLKGKQIRTNWASRKPQPPQVRKLDVNEVANKASLHNCTVYVGNLPEYIAVEALRGLFHRFGEIINIRILADKGYAFISFKEHMEAAHAICEMHGENLKGNVLKCSWGKEQDTHAVAMQQYYQQQYYYHQPYYGGQQQPQQQSHHQQQQQQHMPASYVQMPAQSPYYYPYAGQMVPVPHNYPGAGQHMQNQGAGGGGQQGPNNGTQGGAMGYSM